MNQRKPYSTDISNSQWAILKPLIPAQKTGGRPRTVDMREIINAIFYIRGSSSNRAENPAKALSFSQ